MRPWDTLNADEKKLFSRLMEVYAGFSEYTDAQVGRIIDYLEKSGQLDNTLVFYAADNGASGEGSPNGSVNENKFFNGYPDELSENMKLIDVLGGPDTYEHYPDRMGRRHLGAVQDVQALLGIRRRHLRPAGHLLAQGHQGDAARSATSITTPPTSSRRFWMSAGWRCRRSISGVEQYPLSGVSMRYTFDAKPDAPTQKKRQYYAMLGTRGIWEDGWKAVAVHAPISGKGHFDKDVWELYHVDVDRAESKNLAKEHPEKLQALIKAWFEEADKNLVLPLDDRTRARSSTSSGRPTEPPRERYIYYPGTSPVPEGVAVNVRGRSYKILADVEITATARRDLRPRIALRRPLAVHQGQEAVLRLQLPRHPAGTAVRLAAN